MPMTEVQERSQTWGPFRPSVSELRLILDLVPGHHDVQSVAINGQTGEINIETRYEDMEWIFTFERENGKFFRRTKTIP